MSAQELFEAIEAQDEEKVRSCIGRNPETVHARDAQGATPLHYAAFAGLQDIARLLLDAGADVNALDGRFAATPAGWAIEYLRERGALLGIEIRDAKLAIERGDAAWLAHWLERLPALETARDESGNSLAELAQRSGNPNIAALFAGR
jgi:ankyrin repeat protein